MRDDLVTVATFSDPIEANLAKNNLEAAGVHALLADQEAVDMIFAAGSALGWIKLQVGNDDVNVARAVLNQLDNHKTLGEIELAQASLGTSETRWIPEFDEEEAGDDEAEPRATERDNDAERAFRGAILGLLFLPLQIFVFYLLLRIFVSTDSLGDRQRRKVLIASVINLPLMIGLCFLLRAVLSSF